MIPKESKYQALTLSIEMHVRKCLLEPCRVSVIFYDLPFNFCRLINHLETRVLRPIQLLLSGNLFTYHSSCMKNPKISSPAFQPKGRMKIKMRVQQSQMQDKPKESAWKGKDEELAQIGQENNFLERERNQQLRKERITVNSDRE